MSPRRTSRLGLWLGVQAGTQQSKDQSRSQPFAKLCVDDDNGGDVLQLVLKHCGPPHTTLPTMLWRCAASAVFLRDTVREVL